MSVYLHDIPLSEAQALFQTTLKRSGLWRVLGQRTIPLTEHAIGRVLAAPIWAKISSPHYHASAMDGFAVRAMDTMGASLSTPIILKIRSASGNQDPLCAQYVDTGDPLPDGLDAVIPIENVESLGKNGNLTSEFRHPVSIRIRAGVPPWSHVRPLGEDIIVTQLILPAGHVLRPVDLGVIAAAGYRSLRVARRPRVAVLPTGSELVPIGSDLKAGDIIEYNSLVLAGQIKEWGGTATRFPITPDNLDDIVSVVKKATLHHDLILLNAGSSAGADDYSVEVIKKLGTLLVHGVALRPGHPVILGVTGRMKEINRSRSQRNVSDSLSPITYGCVPIIGVPGYPVSAAMTGEIFVEPLLARWTGRPPLERPIEQAYLTRKIVSPAGDDDYVRVAVGKVGEKFLAAPLSRGAGIISSLARADGLALLPRGVQGAEAGQLVAVSLYRTKAELLRTIFCVGSHDMTLDLLSQFLSQNERRLVSANVGSQAGLLALKRGEAHIAGSHLLDIETGEYNITHIRKYLVDIPVRVYGFVERVQGIMVKRGNPYNITCLEDLGESPVRFINRQRGAGTRILLDYMLSKKGIPAESIQGYNQEEYTHLNVATAVASGRADCCLGIPAAAHALELDFIPLCKEKYHLVMPAMYCESELLAPLFDVINTLEFQKAVKGLPGYSVEEMGKLIAEV